MKTPLAGWDSWHDSYLKYLQDMQKKAAARCVISSALSSVSGWMHGHGVEKPLWQLSLHCIWPGWQRSDPAHCTASPGPEAVIVQPAQVTGYFSRLRGEVSACGFALQWGFVWGHGLV